MPYLTAVLNESESNCADHFHRPIPSLTAPPIVLRLYPQVPMNTRSTIKTTLLPKGGGPDGESPVLVPRKAGITFSPYHMHRRKELFGEDANEFKPERWLDGSLANIGYAYMPFLHGYRTCLGSMLLSFSVLNDLATWKNRCS